MECEGAHSECAAPHSVTTLRKAACRSLAPPGRIARVRRARARCETNTVGHCQMCRDRLQQNIAGLRPAVKIIIKIK